MFENLRRRFMERRQATTARLAAEGTYEAIRRAILYSPPDDSAEMEEGILSSLAARPAWRRVDDDTLIVRRGEVEATVKAEHPLEISRLFRSAAEAEITVFCAGVDDVTMRRLQEVGRQELGRLFQRDGLPWIAVARLEP